MLTGITSRTTTRAVAGANPLQRSAMFIASGPGMNLSQPRRGAMLHGAPPELEIFNRRAGYFGTDFISDVLYAINDPYAIHIVAFLWFSYAASFVFILLFFSRRLYRKR